jgi:DNA-binding NarL/FixJ family response regulator
VMKVRPYKHNGRRVAKVRWLLLVEDQALFREGLALLLEWHTGLSSVQAGSLAEAQRILRDTKDWPACAIVDLELPDGDGIDLLEQLRGLPKLALTSGRSLERRTRALEVGADEVLSKAESAEKIADVVERLVGG